MQDDEIIEDDDEEQTDEIYLYAVDVLNERLPGGRTLLASCDVHLSGISILGCCLTLDRDNKIKFSPPHATGKRRHNASNRCIQFKSKGVRDKMTGLCLAAYREIADEDWTRPAFRRKRAAA